MRKWEARLEEMRHMRQSETHIAEVLGVKVLATAFGGHCYLVRKRIRGNVLDGFGKRLVDGVALPEAISKRVYQADVLAVGPRVSQKCSKRHALAFDRARCYGEGAKVGDLVIVRPRGPGLQVAPWCVDMDDPIDWFIEESYALAVLDCSGDGDG